jgi:hypothetical protein
MEPKLDWHGEEFNGSVYWVIVSNNILLYCNDMHYTNLLYQNPKVQRRQYQIPPLDAILSQLHPPPILTTHFRKIHLTG